MKSSVILLIVLIECCFSEIEEISNIPIEDKVRPMYGKLSQKGNSNINKILMFDRSGCNKLPEANI